MLELLPWIAGSVIAALGAFYLRRLMRRWEAEDEFYDRWEFGGWADEVSDPANETIPRQPLRRS